MATAEKQPFEAPSVPREGVTSTAPTSSPERRRFNVDEYYRMADAGILRSDARVELIDGDIIVMSPIGIPHASCVDRLSRLIGRILGDRAFERVQGPIRLNQGAEPLPDLAIITPRADDYAKAHPGPGDVLFVIEVMDSSADYDRGVKLGLYARAGIPEVWLVDLNEDRVEAYRKPAGGKYDDARVLARGQSLAPEAFPDVALEVDAILG
jgi:Uma2 family endonuclease